MENQNGAAPLKTLMMIIFEGRYYVGEPSQDKGIALLNVAEFTQVKVPGDSRLDGIFMGDIQAGQLEKRLIVNVHPGSSFYSGYFKVLSETFTKQKEAKDAQESILPI